MGGTPVSGGRHGRYSESVDDSPQYSPQILRPEVKRSQRSSLSGGQQLRAGRCAAEVETAAGGGGACCCSSLMVW